MNLSVDVEMIVGINNITPEWDALVGRRKTSWTWSTSHPLHVGEIECVDYQRQQLGGFRFYALGQV